MKKISRKKTVFETVESGGKTFTKHPKTVKKITLKYNHLKLNLWRLLNSIRIYCTCWFAMLQWGL
jgi:hypothetical protein